MEQAVKASPQTTKPARAPRAVSRKARLITVGFSLFLYLLACISPVFYLTGSSGEQTWRGFDVLLMGVLGVFLGQFGWFANPFFALSLLTLLLHRWKLTLTLNILAIFIAMDTFSFLGKEIPADEAYVNVNVLQRFEFGVYIWLASIASVGIGAIWWWFRQRAIQKTRPANEVLSSPNA